MFESQKLYWKDRFQKMQNCYTFRKTNCTLGSVFWKKYIHWNDKKEEKSYFLKKGEKIG